MLLVFEKMKRQKSQWIPYHDRPGISIAWPGQDGHCFQMPHVWVPPWSSPCAFGDEKAWFNVDFQARSPGVLHSLCIIHWNRFQQSLSFRFDKSKLMTYLFCGPEDIHGQDSRRPTWSCLWPRDHWGSVMGLVTIFNIFINIVLYYLDVYPGD